MAGIMDRLSRLIRANINDLIDNVTEIGDNADDIDTYDDYQSQGEDETAQEWAGR